MILIENSEIFVPELVASNTGRSNVLSTVRESLRSTLHPRFLTAWGPAARWSAPTPRWPAGTTAMRSSACWIRLPGIGGESPTGAEMGAAGLRGEGSYSVSTE